MAIARQPGDGAKLQRFSSADSQDLAEAYGSESEARRDSENA